MATVKQIEKFLAKVEEETDVAFDVCKNGDRDWLIEGEYWSDLGEDVIISLVVDELTTEAITHEMYLYSEYFDAEEHAAELYNLHGSHGTPTGLRALLTDADEQQEKLDEIIEVMNKLSK